MTQNGEKIKLENLIQDVKYVKNTAHEGVFMRNFFSREDNDRINNSEVCIMPGFQIAPHIHEDSTEFFYVVSGMGEFLDSSEWKPIKKGDAFKAPQGMTHGIKNAGSELLVILATFSPPIR
jgi:mannose-6-phosphate isomerase-like protein (cupin superfamily)